MKRTRLATLLVAVVASAGCGDPETGGPASGDAAGGGGDGGGGPGGDGAGPGPDAGPSACPGPASPKRGAAWVRANPMFISGLTVQMPAPGPAAVSDYFDGFHASAVHLWLDGLPTAMSAWRGPANHRFVAWVRDDGTALNTQLVGGYPAAVPGRIGYQIGDEPASMAALVQMAQGLAAVRAHDPDALVYVNFSVAPDELADMLEYYGTTTSGDVISYDRYSRSNSTYNSLEQFRAAGLRFGLPYWAYLRSYRGPGSTDSSPSDMRWDVYRHATYGFTGYSWFVYQMTLNNDPFIEGVSLFAQTGDFAAGKTPAFAVASGLNVELANLGRTLTQLTSTDVRYLAASVLSQPPGTRDWAAGAGGDPYLTGVSPRGNLAELLVGFFVDDCGDHYLMVQNPNHTGGSFPVDSASAVTVDLTFDFAAAPADVARDQLQVLDATTGAIGTTPLVVSGAGATLALTLAAGDARLLKYRTSRPFVVQPAP
jgi:hypothetical protein